ncbi:FecR family protein [Echinicola shivajiensis]|uniref:FecR family protein n=1 Tax=Echinicola shivajiensis TaxID=1035916 RepID=UPI001BFC76A7|nr:FecR family protein [Echinicola shivajiensis]
MKSFENIEDFLGYLPFKGWVRSGADMDGEFYIWFKDNYPTSLDMLFKAKMVMEELEAPNRDWSKLKEDDLFRGISSQISPVKRSYGRRKLVSTPTLLVGMLVLVISSLLVWDNELKSFFEEPIEEVIVEKWTVRDSKVGQKSKVFLPDGTIAFLNSGSQIKYDKDFGINNRDLSLQGEAFFEVAKNKEIPFKVMSGKVVTEAVGTAFNVRAFDIKDIGVQLTEGKVKVYPINNPEEKLLLLPGEQVVYQGDEFPQKGRFDLEYYPLWVKGTLSFDKASLSESVELLERWYGVKIEVHNAPKNEFSFSGKYRKATLENVLESMSHSLQLSYKIENKNVTLIFQ